MKRWSPLLALLALLSCHSPPKPTPYLRIGLFSPHTSLDPLYARDQVSVWLVQQLFEGLVAYDTALRIVPALAARYEILDQGLRYRFYLRRGVRFHRSNRTLCAQDVLYSWHRLADPQWASPGSYLFAGLVAGWDAYRNGTTKQITGLRAIGDSVVEVCLTRPYAPFLHLLTLPYAMVVFPEAAQAAGKRFSEHPIGTGPYQWHYEETGRLLVLQKNPHYWALDTASPAGLVFRWFANRLWAYEALRRAEIDAFEGLDRNLLHLLQSDSSWQVWAYHLAIPQLGTEYLGMDIRPEAPLGDVRLRQALSWAVQQFDIAQTLFKGQVQLALTFLPPALRANEPPPPPHEPDSQTWQRLQSLGLTLYGPPGAREVCEFLQSRLSHLGLHLKVDYLLGPSLRERLQKTSLPLWKASWIADFPDGENFLILFESSKVIPQGPNTTRFSDPIVDSLLEVSRRLIDQDSRRALYTEIEQRVLAQQPVIPLYHPQGHWLLRREVQTFPNSPLSVWLPLHLARKVSGSHSLP